MTTARAGVSALARITAAPDGRGRTVLSDLVSDGPLALRRTRSLDDWAQPRHGAHDRHGAQATLVGAMSAPLNGDRLRLEASVAPGAALRVTSAAATIALPGRAPGPATYEVTLTVGEGAELHWLPEPLISVTGSDLRLTTRVELAPTARLVLREEQILGRTGERPGRLTSRLVVRRAGLPLLDQELSFGPGAPGWDGGAVLDGYRAAGQLLVVDPALGEGQPPTRLLGDTAVLTPLAGPALLATAVAPDALGLRRTLDRALHGHLPQDDEAPHGDTPENNRAPYGDTLEDNPAPYGDTPQVPDTAPGSAHRPWTGQDQRPPCVAATPRVASPSTTQENQSQPLPPSATV